VVRLVLDDRDALDEAAAALAGMFADAELSLRRALAVQVRAGLERDPDDVLRHLRLAQLRDDARAVVDRLLAATPDEVTAVLAAASQAGTAAALSELSVLAGVRDLAAVTAAASGAFAAQALTLDLVSSFDDVTRRILRWPDDVYREAVAGPTSRLLLGLGQTTHTAQAAAWQRLIGRGVTGFVDKAARRWNLATYVEMAMRTAARRAWDAQHEHVLTSAGMDLVSVVVGSDACRRCAAWAGKILQVGAGPVGWVRVERADGPGTVRVFVVGTLEQARDAGWHHPNCRCRVVAYLPGVSVVEDATTYDPEAEADREQLRALEREVRRAKLDEAAAVTPEQERAARRHRLDLQAQIREHVADTGLNRKRYREQVSLGRQVT
jgi:hypothetical protein